MYWILERKSKDMICVGNLSLIISSQTGLKLRMKLSMLLIYYDAPHVIYTYLYSSFYLLRETLQIIINVIVFYKRCFVIVKSSVIFYESLRMDIIDYILNY